MFPKAVRIIIHAMKAVERPRWRITEVGGKSAHLVKVGRELVSMLRIPDARKTLPHHAYAHLSSKRERYILSKRGS